MTWVELQELIKKTFKKTDVQDSETQENKKEWIISFNNLATEDILVAHTKFIFYYDENKEKITKNEFLYLYDINCKYRLVKFKNSEDLESKLQSIIKNKKFGDNLMIISDFIAGGMMGLNNFMTEKGVNGFNVSELSYVPNPIITPCQNLNFNFEIEVNMKYVFNFQIKKQDNKEFIIMFQYMDEMKKYKMSDLKNLTPLIVNWMKKYISKD